MFNGILLINNMKMRNSNWEITCHFFPMKQLLSWSNNAIAIIFDWDYILYQWKPYVHIYIYTLYILYMYIFWVPFDLHSWWISIFSGSSFLLKGVRGESSPFFSIFLSGGAPGGNFDTWILLYIFLLVLCNPCHQLCSEFWFLSFFFYFQKSVFLGLGSCKTSICLSASLTTQSLCGLRNRAGYHKAVPPPSDVCWFIKQPTNTSSIYLP